MKPSYQSIFINILRVTKLWALTSYKKLRLQQVKLQKTYYKTHSTTVINARGGVTSSRPHFEVLGLEGHPWP